MPAQPAAASLLTATVLSMLGVACGGTSGSSTTMSTRPRASVTAAAFTPPAVTASRIATPSGTLRPGTAVRNRDVGVRVFATTSDGYALATIGGSTYPARSVNGGASWKITGPVLHQPRAQGPLAVDQIGVAGKRTAFAWSGVSPGTIVDITTDAGARWWRAFFPGSVLFVGRSNRQVIAEVNGSVTKGGVTHQGLWAYRTRTGQQWTFAHTIR